MVRASVVPAFLVAFSLVGQAPDAPQTKPLSLKAALQLALENNLQVTIAQQRRIDTQSGVQTNLGAFDWNLAAGASVSHLKGGNSSNLKAMDGTAYLSHSDKDSYARNLTVELEKKFAWGGTLEFAYAPTYRFDKSQITNVTGALDTSGMPIPNYTTNSGNPYSGTLSTKYTQSLLNGFGTAVNTAPLVVARKNAEGADYTYQLAIISLLAATENQYWDAVFAERNLINQRTSLELAKKLLKENTIRVEVGTMAPIEVTSAEAQVAQAEQNIITGEAQVRNSQDALQRALFPNGAAQPLQLTDGPELAHIQLDEAAAEKMALTRRLELKTAKLNTEISKVKEQAAVNRTLPQLDAFVQYNGASGDNYGSLSPVNTDLTGMKFPGYTVGLQFRLPIQNRIAKGNLASARATSRSSELTQRDQELTIALQARSAARDAEAAEKGVAAAAKTRYYQERNLEAEHKKFENGMSTNFVVLQVMTNLDNAKSAELNAQIRYARTVTALEVAVGNLMEARNFTVK